MVTMNILHPKQPSPTRPRPSATGVAPSGSGDVQPISEAQFAAIVRHFEVAETDEGLVYTKDSHPWEFKRRDSYLTVTHRTIPQPSRYFEIVRPSGT